MRAWILIALLCVVSGGCGGGGGGGGGLPATLSSGSFIHGSFTEMASMLPLGCVAGHFDDDALLDLAVIGGVSADANGLEVGLDVYAGQDGGGFLLAAPAIVALPQPTASYAVLTGYFDLDARLDLVVLNGLDFLVLLGNGDGTFDPATSTFGLLLPGNVLTDAHVVDANGDLYSDLAYGTVDGRAGFLLGNGGGGFVAGGQVVVSPGAQVFSVAPSFINPGDDVDLAALDSTGKVTTLHGNGAGGLAFAQSLTVGSAGVPRRILVGDFGLAGDANLAVEEESPVKARFFPGDGGGGFTVTGAQTVTFPDEDAGPLALVRQSLLADDSLVLRATATTLAPDGLPDETLYLIRNDGSGTFTTRALDEVFPHAMCFAAADVNRDWRTDLLVVGVTAAGDNLDSFIQMLRSTGQ